MENKSFVKEAARIALVLLLISAVVAGVVSLVYSITIDAYEENLRGEISKSISEIFDASENDDIQYEELDSSEFSDVKAVYSVSKNGTPAGYCVNIIGAGFGGDINLMIGYDSAQKILGITVVSSAETTGFSKEATRAEFLERFVGHEGAAEISKKEKDGAIVAISGATISSKAVGAAVSRAAEVLTELCPKVEVSK